MGRLILTLLLLSSLMLFACGDSSTNCDSDTDCAGTEHCLWVKQGGQVIGKRCSLLCSANEQCPPGESCDGNATSCPACGDFKRICNAP